MKCYAIDDKDITHYNYIWDYISRNHTKAIFEGYEMLDVKDGI